MLHFGSKLEMLSIRTSWFLPHSVPLWTVQQGTGFFLKGWQIIFSSSAVGKCQYIHCQLKTCWYLLQTNLPSYVRPQIWLASKLETSTPKDDRWLTLLNCRQVCILRAEGWVCLKTLCNVRNLYIIAFSLKEMTTCLEYTYSLTHTKHTHNSLPHPPWFFSPFSCLPSATLLSPFSQYQVQDCWIRLL